jgi:hypothetical protein
MQDPKHRIRIRNQLVVSGSEKNHSGSTTLVQMRLKVNVVLSVRSEKKPEFETS